MAVLGYDPEMSWRCDGCQQVFQAVYDQEIGEEQNLPALATSDGHTWCESCFAERFGPGPYEPE
jgi:hypothetical protein